MKNYKAHIFETQGSHNVFDLYFIYFPFFSLILFLFDFVYFLSLFLGCCIFQNHVCVVSFNLFYFLLLLVFPLKFRGGLLYTPVASWPLLKHLDFFFIMWIWSYVCANTNTNKISFCSNEMFFTYFYVLEVKCSCTGTAFYSCLQFPAASTRCPHKLIII